VPNFRHNTTKYFILDIYLCGCDYTCTLLGSAKILDGRHLESWASD